MKKSIWRGLSFLAIAMVCSMNNAFADIAVEPVKEVVSNSKGQVNVSSMIIIIFAILLVVVFICGLILFKIVKKKP